MRVKLWSISLLLGITTIFLYKLDLVTVYNRIDWNIIFYLYGMFLLGYILEKSNYLTAIAQTWLPLDNPKKLMKTSVKIPF